MLHTSQTCGFTPSPYAMTLHRERKARLARLSPAVAPSPKARLPQIVQKVEILVYPAHVFADDCDRYGEKEDVSPGRIREIQNLICKNLRVLRSELLSARREREIVSARQIAMYLCKVHTPNSFPDLGRRFGGRDHTTVLHAVKRVELMVGSPIGTGISRQWRPEACDLVRRHVRLAEMAIRTWGDDRITRTAHPKRAR